MARRAGGGPDQIELGQPRVPEQPHRLQMTDGRDATDGKAGLGADQIGIGLAKRLAGDGAGLLGADPVAAGGEEQHDMAAVLAAEDDRFRDLVDGAACGFGRLGGGAGLAHLADLDRGPGRGQRRLDPFQRLAHFALLRPCSPRSSARGRDREGH
ncbi:hypothetical protein SDC9_34622 [bioreactor metagenome]|uniref:Uncharacterized protein n=1 Tax=bioreactor metagenome TaxID=1076179 RepID=A0A644VB69_9ZZZZ